MDGADIVSQEESGKGKIGSKFYRQYFGAMKDFKIFGPLLFLLLLVETSQSGAFRWALGFWVDALKPPQESSVAVQSEFVFLNSTLTTMQSFIQSNSAYLVVAVIFALIVIFVLLRALSWFFMSVFLSRGGRVLHERMVLALSRVRVTFFDEHPTGRITNRFVGDYDQLKRDLPNYINDIFGCLAEILWVLVLVVFQVPWIVVASGPCVLMYMRIQNLYSSSSREVQRAARIQESPMWSLYTEAAVGWQSIRTYGKTLAFQQRFVSLYENYFDYALLRSRITRWLNVRLKLISEIFSLFLTIFVAVAYFKGKISIGTAGFVMSAGMGLDSTMQWLTRTFSMIEASMVSLERVLEYTHLEAENGTDLNLKNDGKPPHPEHLLEKSAEKFVVQPSVSSDTTISATATANTTAAAAATCVTHADKPRLSFENYTAAYRLGLQPILNEVSFDIKYGEKIGIIGRTGAGKSSIFQALFGMLHVTSGYIKINEHDMALLNIDKVRSLFGIVPQEPHLFSGTIRSNLDRIGNMSDAKLFEALEKVQLKGLVSQYSLGLDHPVAEKGLNFSSGQRQLICMARAILLDNKIIFLDEATSSLDSQTDLIIKSVVATEFRFKTVLTIAHRLSTLSEMDRILIFENGRLAAQGDTKSILNEFLEKNKNSLSEFGLLHQESSVVT